MSSDKLDNIVFSPFIRAFTIEILKNFMSLHMKEKKVDKIEVSLVPHISKEVLKPSIMSSRKIEVPQKFKTKNEVPNIKPKFAKRKLPEIQPKLKVHANPKAVLIKPVQKGVKAPVGEYGKLTGLILDPSVTYIEDQGAGKALTIIRAGQRQFTKISLSEQEIRDFLNLIAQKARVPLLEGVFRVAVDNFAVSAVVSELIGSRFTIRKNTPYSLLENPQNVQGRF
jgi:hypothetical protein